MAVQSSQFIPIASGGNDSPVWQNESPLEGRVTELRSDDKIAIGLYIFHIAVIITAIVALVLLTPATTFLFPIIGLSIVGAILCYGTYDLWKQARTAQNL